MVFQKKKKDFHFKINPRLEAAAISWQIIEPCQRNTKSSKSSIWIFIKIQTPIFDFLTSKYYGFLLSERGF
jgi:hypothetical protein